MFSFNYDGFPLCRQLFVGLDQLVIIGYPSDDYLRFLMNEDGLTLTDELDLADLFPGDRRERLLCFSAEE